MIRDDSVQLRLHQEAIRCQKTGRPCAGRFLSGNEQALAIHEAREAGVQIAFDGGFDDAERVQPCFYEHGDDPFFTAQWVEARWNAKFVHPDHRDLFGSLMGLGIDRSFFGDLIAFDDHAYLLALPDVAIRLPSEWTQAGRSPITVSLLSEAPSITPPAGMMLHDTVPSTRLDAVLSSGMKLSRSKAADIIRAGHVSVDHQVEERTDRLLTAGQLLSVRGFGRIRLKEIGTPTRKDRLPIDVEIFKKS